MSASTSAATSTPQGDLVTSTNRLLASVGINDRPFTAVEEVQDNSSSLLVAVFEAVFSTRITDVRRRPTAQPDYAFNAQRVIDSLRAILPPRVVIPGSVTGDAIAGGDLPSITFLVSLLGDVDRVIRKPSAPFPPSTPSRSIRGENAEGQDDDEGELLPPSTPEHTAETLAASALGTSGEHADNVTENARLAAMRMAEFAGVHLKTTTTTTASSSSGAGAGGEADAEPLGATNARGSTGNDIWSGQSPDKVRAKAQNAGLGNTLKSTTTSTSAPPPNSPGLIKKKPTTTTTATSSTTATTKGKTATAAAKPRTATTTTTSVKKAAATTIRPPVLPASVHAAGAAAIHHDEFGGGGEHHSSSGSGNEQHLDAGAMLGEEQAKKAAAAAQAAQRRAHGVMSRLLAKNQEELQNIQTMTDEAMRSREAEFRVMEAKAIKAATARAKAAKHERKVLALRTRQTLEDLARHTLGLRIARSSRQATATASLLKALAAQERLAAAEKLRMATDEQARTLDHAQGSLAWAAHQAKLINELVMEETTKQVMQRQAAARSQRDALNRAVRDMRADEDALLERMKAEQSHAEDAFLAQHVEPMQQGAGPLNGASIARERLTDQTDTDADSQRVFTLNRTQTTLTTKGAERTKSASQIQERINQMADDANAGYEAAEKLTSEAKAVLATTGGVVMGKKH